MCKNYFKKLMNYIRNVYNIDGFICKMKDSRIYPTYRSDQVVLTVLFGFLLRIKSFNELNCMLKENEFARLFPAGTRFPMIDAIRDTPKVTDLKCLGKMNRHIIRKVIGNKALFAHLALHAPNDVIQFGLIYCILSDSRRIFMDYTIALKCHYKPKKGWMNDPNGLVWFKGFYHAFYQHDPHHEIPWQEPVHWGHARTKDFLTWEELPVALHGDSPYDQGGCWSGTAIVKDGTLYILYASINTLEHDKMLQTVSVAYSTDGIHFEKYEHNPVITHYPPEGCKDFRDPAVACIDGKFYCVMATGYPKLEVGRVLLYKGENLFDWKLCSIMCEWNEAKYAECPSFMQVGDKCLLSASVCKLDGSHFFSIMYGSFVDNRFTPEITGIVDRGPDQYAGQIFTDHKGRNLLITWIPGWKYARFAEKNVGCLSIPREITIKNGKVCGYPIEEVRYLLRDSDPAVRRTDDGFIIERTLRDPIIHKGEIADLKILRDEYIIEVFVNGGETIYSALLC